MQRKLLTAAAITAAVAGGGVVGALVGAPAFSGAQENPTTTVAPADPSAAPAPAPDGSTHDPAAEGRGHGAKGKGGPRGPHQANGKTEAVLTGDDAAKVTAAAQAAVPGATIDRIETDADGDAYEAHVTKEDGTDATVKLDANFAVTSVQDGRR
jgi:hypothetical protein